MANVVLIIHLILAISLICVVLLQRSEGGALGIGGGGGGVVSQRGAATALAKITWAVAIAFLVTSLALTILAKQSGTGSVLEKFETGSDTSIPLPALPAPDASGGDLLPPAPAGDSGGGEAGAGTTAPTSPPAPQ